MCRDNSYYAKREEHLSRWSLENFGEEWQPTYHKIAGSSDWPIIVHDSVADKNDSPIAHWGLIPFWTKNRADGMKMSNSMVNARVETIVEKPAYKNLIYSSRCILPSTGFYEHHHVLIGKKDTSIPFYIKPVDQAIFGLAGIYTTWTDRTTGEVITSFSVITTAANEHMQRIHNHGDNKHRMPVMLEPDMETAWLDKGTPAATIDEIRNYRIAAEKLQSWPVQSVRKRDRPDDPTLLARVHVEQIDWA